MSGSLGSLSHLFVVAEVAARVVGRVREDHVDLTAFAVERDQRLEVVALDDEIPRSTVLVSRAMALDRPLVPRAHASSDLRASTLPENERFTPAPVFSRIISISCSTGGDSSSVTSSTTRPLLGMRKWGGAAQAGHDGPPQRCALSGSVDQEPLKTRSH